MMAFFYNSYYVHKVYRGVYLNGQHLEGWSYSDVYNFLEEKSIYLSQNGLEYKFEDKIVAVQTKLETLDDPDLSRELIRFYNTETTRAVFEEGRDYDLIKNILNQMILIIRPAKFSWQYDFDKEEWKDVLKDNFSEYEITFIPPQVNIDSNEIKIEEAVDGKEFDYEQIIELTENRIDSLDFSIIELNLKNIKSPVTKIEAEAKKDLIQEIIDLEEIVLNYKERFWKINSQIYQEWLTLKKRNEEILISFDFEKYQKHIQDNIVVYLDQEAQNAKFEIKDGRVIEFQGSHDGLSLNLDLTLEAIEDGLNDLDDQAQLDESDKASIDIEMAVDVIKADVSTQNVNNLGIREIIGVGESDFRGSPRNRVHNINAGADKLNGILIAPGEEFATMKNLTPVDAKSGYLPELVIKGNKTIPEYGGGLCQIGTTVYRAALQSGLKITQRRPHSYRVYYYEPAGMDATIY
ncbi:VanW family protein, partial [bacterium]|nr:VanW family protein [bacterium]